MHGEKKIYKTLQKHLHTMPVGYPATRSGVELRILERIFTPEQAVMATVMTHVFEPPEVICAKAEKHLFNGHDRAACETMLDEMAEKGSIFSKFVDGRTFYALAPFVVGMFEFQLSRLTPGFYEDAARYFREGYGLEYLSTAIPQMRVIPIGQSIDEKQHIATYDEARRLVEEAGDRIGVADCICRRGKDLAGDPCRATQRRSLCLGLRDYFDMYNRQGWLKKITSKEALEILAQSEKEGLVLQATNEQEPQAICACCGCCCGILSTLKHVPNRADFAAGNFYAQADPDLCVGCGRCMERCHVDAIALCDKVAAVDPSGCIGCGVCVPSCKKGAMSLVSRAAPNVPPKDTAELYDTILKKKRRLGKLRTGLKILGHISARKIKFTGLRNSRH
ncbi:MAG: 4Fe-4S binding protein [Desulfosalsimonadaceae bacterium]